MCICAGIESVDEMVTWNFYQWIINFNVGKRHAHEVVKCNVDQRSIKSAKGSDVKGMDVVAHSGKTTSETKGAMKEPSGNHSGRDYKTKDEFMKRLDINIILLHFMSCSHTLKSHCV